ncbi:MAG: ATP-binding protein, partial [Campylobacterales bacterium]
IILQNSKEAFEERTIQRPELKISLYSKDGFAFVEIFDNAGGCEESILGKIFEPFFGTKQSSTGSGLYLAKIIVEQQMNGFISAKNDSSGLSVIIGLPEYYMSSR